MTISEIADKAIMPREPGFDTVTLPVNVVIALIADWRAMREYIEGVEDTTDEFYSAMGCRRVLNALKVKP